MFALAPLPGLSSGTEIRNVAAIRFETQPPLTTNEVINVIDTDVPACTVDGLPSQSPPSFKVSWSGDEDTELYSIFVSTDDGPFTLHASVRTTSLHFQGVPEARYDFLCIATDVAGNSEVQPPLAESSTTTVQGNSPPVAQCLDRIVPPDPGVCTAAVSVNNASFDPEGDPITLAQSPPGPYALGLTNVTLTVTDDQGASDACTATVTVQDRKRLTSLSPAQVWVGLKNSDAVGLRMDLKAEVFLNATKVGEGQLNDVASGSSGFNNAKLNTIPLTLTAPGEIPANAALKITLSVCRTCSGEGHNSGTPRPWFNDSQANSRLGTTVDATTSEASLRDPFSLTTTPGTGPKKTIDVPVDNKASCPNRPFKPFGTWSRQWPCEF